MFDGFWPGLFGGLFGPVLAQWLSRFKYWIIFFTTIVGVHIISFIQDCWEFGAIIAFRKTTDLLSKTVGIFAPMGIGLLVVFVAFVGFLSAPKKPNEHEQDKKP